MDQQIPKGVCRDYWKRGKCTYGKQCRFKHETNQNPNITRTQPNAKQNFNREINDDPNPHEKPHALPRFSSVIHKDFRHQHDMRKFVLSALKEPDTGDVVLALGNTQGGGIKKLRDILQCEFQIRAGNSASKYSFERIVVPLCHLLTLPQFQNSPHATSLRVIYGAVFSEILFFPKVIQRCKELMKYGRFTPEKTDEEENVWTPQDWKEVIRPIVKLFFTVLTRVADASADDSMPELLVELKNLAGTEPDTETLSILNKAQTAIDSVRQKERREMEAKKSSQEIVDFRLAASLQTDAEVPYDVLYQPGPGEIHPEGPRHNNDFADFRQIKIVPTEDEILCIKEPYIPSPQGSEHVANPVDRYLDIHFRQLREDMLTSVRRGVQGFLNQNALAHMGKSDVKYSVRPTVGGINSNKSDSVALHVYRRVSISDPLPNLNRGVCFRVEFEQLPHVTKMTKRQRLDFWKVQAGSRQLDVSSLICIALGVTSTPEGTARADRLIFATVAEKREDDLVGDRCLISIQLLDSAVTTELAAYVSNTSENNDKKENVMLQVRGHFFPGYEPVLSALQAHSVASMPFADFIVEEPDLTDMRPQFLKDDTVFNLSVIQKSTADLGLRSCQVGDYENLKETLHDFEDHLILDNTQIDAFAAALTRKVSLIQGPPGTGKTYIGIQIVRALLANSSGARANNWEQRGRIAPVQEAPIPALHPILCICYTNHALDQFLEGLIHAGIAAENIVRAGGRSQSEVLSERNLHKLQFNNRTQGEKSEFGKLKKEANQLEEQIQESVAALKTKSFDAFLRWMQTEYPDHYSSITMQGGEDDEGFEAAAKPAKVADTWLTQEEPSIQVLHQENTKSLQTLNIFEMLDETVSVPATINQNSNPRRRIQTNAEPRSFRELFNVRDCWTMSMAERKLFFDTAYHEFRKERSRELEKDIESYNNCVRKNKEINDATQLRVLKGAQIVGFTTSGCAKYQTLLKALQPRVIICEEAGEVLESHVLASLTSGSEQLILIGDHLQLRPKVTEYSLSIDSGNGYNLDVSLFERLVIKYQRKYRNAADLRQLGLLCTLDTQRRMRPAIADILRGTLYPTLQDSDTVRAYPQLQGFAKDLWFFDHDWKENTDTGEQSVAVQSYFNQKEAEMAVELVRYAIRQGYKKEQIAVLTPYVGQLILLRKLLSQKKMLLQLEEKDLILLEAAGVDDSDLDQVMEEENDNNNGNKNQGVQRVSLKERVRLSTVDNFQGEEAELVIISSVRCNARGRTGFLKISNRVNVMLSRAKHGMIILGSSATIKRSRNADMFHAILKILEDKNSIGNFIDLRCKNHKGITHITKASEFEHLDGGCNRPCNFRMECGHSCFKLCHPDEAPHDKSECKQPCEKIIPSCGHPCQNLCFQKCGGCTVISKVRLSCGHTMEIPCSQATSAPKCTEKVVLQMPLCGHTEEMPCWKSTELQEVQSLLKLPFDPKLFNKHSAIFSCSHKCEQLLKCDHQCQRNCGECSFATITESKTWSRDRTVHGKCTTACSRSLFCGHTCSGGTCHPSSDCPSCKLACFNKCEHSSCGKKCNEPCDTCVQACTWACICGKKVDACPMVCGSPCTRLPCDSRCPKTLKCGHQCPSLCGEPCPDVEFCPLCAPTQKKDQVVDMIMMATLGEHDPNESPLLVLPCKHVFTVETLDGVVEIEKVYQKNKEGKWNGLVPLDNISEEDTSLLKCPTCRSPIYGIRRYGRMLNLALIRRIRQKHFLYIQEKSAGHQKQIEEITKQIQNLTSKPNPAVSKTNQLRKEINILVEAITRESKECESNAPTLKQYKVDQARAQKAKIQSEMVKLIPPNIQPLLQLLRMHIKALMVRLQFLCTLWGDNDSQQSKRKPKPKEKTRSKAKPEPSQLDLIQRTYEQTIGITEKLLKSCEQAKANKKLSNAWQIYALLHIEFINGLASVQVPEGVKPEPTIRERQSKALESLKDVVQNLPPTSPLQQQVEEIEKKLRDVFYEPPTREEMLAIKNAMELEIGSGVGSFGGHWYQCPNGHAYAIGECGGAMQTSKCPECGEEIGGSNHALNSTNTVATQFLQQVGGQAPPPTWRQDIEQNEQLARQFH